MVSEEVGLERAFVEAGAFTLEGDFGELVDFAFFGTTLCYPIIPP
jgi:hypothetical protein